MFTHTNTAPLLPECRRKHVKVEDSSQHAEFKAHKEVANKTKDPEHTLVVTEAMDDNTILIWACNCSSGRSVFSRAYVVHQPCTM